MDPPALVGTDLITVVEQVRASGSLRTDVRAAYPTAASFIRASLCARLIIFAASGEDFR